MSEIESKVKAIIVDKLGVDEAEVKPEGTFQTVYTVVDGNQTNTTLPQNLHNLTDLQIVCLLYTSRCV